MSTFSQLKQFPFFRKISHWFYPFDPQYQDIAKLSLGNDEQKISLLNILKMCIRDREQGTCRLTRRIFPFIWIGQYATGLYHI